MTFPSAKDIKDVPAYINQLESMKHHFYELSYKKYIDITPINYEEISNFLINKGYAVKRYICSYQNNNECHHPGCMVYHIPSYSPVYSIAVSLKEEDLPKDAENIVKKSITFAL